MKLRIGSARIGRQTGKGDGKTEHARRAIQESVFSQRAPVACMTGAELQRFQLGMRWSKY